MGSVLITLIISLHAVAAAEAPAGAGHVTTVNRAAPKAQPAPGKTPLALLASVGGAPQAGKRAPGARARAQHATAIKHAQLVHLHNRTRAELARRHRGANATNATGARERRPSVDRVAMAPYVPTGRKRGRPRDPNKKRPPKPGPPPEALRVREEDARASESDDESDDESVDERGD